MALRTIQDFLLDFVHFLDQAHLNGATFQRHKWPFGYFPNVPIANASRQPDTPQASQQEHTQPDNNGESSYRNRVDNSQLVLDNGAVANKHLASDCELVEEMVAGAAHEQSSTHQASPQEHMQSNNSGAEGSKRRRTGSDAERHYRVNRTEEEATSDVSSERMEEEAADNVLPEHMEEVGERCPPNTTATN